MSGTHEAAPNASIAFNTRPEDTAEAAARLHVGYNLIDRRASDLADRA